MSLYLFAGRRRAGVLPAGLLALCAVSACALKAPPSREELKPQALPNASVPAAWKSSGGAAGEVADNWLASFRDPVLDKLVAEALQYNADLQVAAARVELAAANAKLAGAQIYPAVNLLARGGGKLSGDSSGIEGVLINATWEMDLWGRVRYGRRAAIEQYVSAEADREYARQSLAALVAKSWFLAAEALIQREIAREMVKASESLVALTEERFKVGISDEYDVVLARATLGGFQDNLQQLELGLAQALRALEVLLGRYPAAEIAVSRQLAALAEPVPAGLPSELLERRPDVISAERRVAAAFDRRQEARTAMLPRIGLTLGVSSISSELFVLQNINNPVWSVGANLVAPLFQGGALQAQVEIRTAEQKQAVAEYARVGLKAFNEVEQALSGGFNLDARMRILDSTVRDNIKALELTEIRYRVGTGDLRSVTQQQTQLNSARMALLRVQAERLVQRVNLHLALGGSFDQARHGVTESKPIEAVQASGGTR